MLAVFVQDVGPAIRIVDDARAHQPQHAAQRCDDARGALQPGHACHGQVEFLVQGHELGDVARGIGLTGQDVAELLDGGSVDVLGEGAHDVGLEHHAQGVELGQLGWLERSNAKAALGQDLDQALGFELAKRFAGGRARDTERLAPRSFRSRRRP